MIQIQSTSSYSPRALRLPQYTPGMSRFHLSTFHSSPRIHGISQYSAFSPRLTESTAWPASPRSQTPTSSSLAEQSLICYTMDVSVCSTFSNSQPSMRRRLKSASSLPTKRCKTSVDDISHLPTRRLVNLLPRPLMHKTQCFLPGTASTTTRRTSHR